MMHKNSVFGVCVFVWFLELSLESHIVADVGELPGAGQCKRGTAKAFRDYAGHTHTHVHTHTHTHTQTHTRWPVSVSLIFWETFLETLSLKQT